eukprot:TRINITY_DN5330_c0_g1_i1.p1 TRINITY_DN5330_c0_g1~~TRINITY_DN5330_c0_g1_i1.p1  ORF type:complete len:578 (-),score=132.02 TRINITY_DN5330_c0_g1_i1:140-1873(-)
MKETCVSMGDRLKATKSTAGVLLTQASSLQDERDKNLVKQKICQAFLQRFRLTNEEINALRGTITTSSLHPSAINTSASLDVSFFKALKRVHQIHTDCKVLLRTHHQTAGLEIMEEMALHQQAGYDRLYRWAKNECRGLEREQPAVHQLMPLAFRALAERSVLLGYCIEEVENIRSKVISRGFVNALTRGGPSGLPRPIEIHAHDPIRYVGDMLGWIHQSIASEYELLSSLLNSDISLEDEVHKKEGPENEKSQEVKKNQINVSKVLSKIFDGICKPFKMRVEQVIEAQPGLVVIWRIANLLDFYFRTVGKNVLVDSMISITLADSKVESLRVFNDMLKEYGESLIASPPSPPFDLSPPHSLLEAINKLMEIMSTYESSLVPNEEREAEFSPVLSRIVDFLLKMCTLSAANLPPSDMAVYLINCISSIQTALSGYSFASKRVEMLEGQIEAHMDTLVEEETSSILSTCGLSQKLSVLQFNSTSPEPLSSLPSMDSKSVTQTIRLFESSLFELGALVMPQCDRVMSGTLRQTSRNQVSQLIISAYAQLYNAIMDPKNKYDNPSMIVRYKPEQFALLCS